MKTAFRSFLLFSLFSLFNINCLIGQSDWTIMTYGDSLYSDNYYLVYPESENKIWAVNEGHSLTLFEDQSTSYYNHTNSILPNAGIRQLMVAFNSLWIASDSGFFSYDGSTFENVSASNPAVFNRRTVQTMTTTSNGDLWIGTDSSVIHYDGQNFKTYLGLRVELIFRDSSDRVFVNSRINSFIYVSPLSSLNSLRYLDNDTFKYFTNFSPNIGTIASYQINDLDESDGKILFVHNDSLAKFSFQNGVENLSKITQDNLLGNLGGGRIEKITFNDDLIYAANAGSRLFNGYDTALYEIPLDYVTKYEGTYYGPPHDTTIYDQDDYYVSINDLKNYASKVYLATSNGIYVSNMSIKRLIDYSAFSLETNNIRTEIYPRSALFQNPDRVANFEFPKDSNSYGGYVGSLILLGKSGQFDGLRRVNHEFYDDRNLGPVGGGGYNLRSRHQLTKTEIQTHRDNYQNPNYTVPCNLANWPANADASLGQAMDLAPFYDANNNGCYDPDNGDYPIIKGDEAIYWIENFPVQDMTMEYHYMFYAYNSTAHPELNDVQFLEIRVINREPSAIDSIFSTFYFDADLGFPIDDYAGSDSMNQITYFYNGDDYDDDFQGQRGYYQNIPAIGVKTLNDNMVGSVYLKIGGGANSAPITLDEYENCLKGTYKDGTPIKYGGNGLDSSSGAIGGNTKFMFTGDPLAGTGWIEATADSGNANNPGDRRMYSILEPFSLAAGESKTVSVVIGYGRKDSVTDHKENIGELVHVLNTAKSFWDTLTTPTISYGQNIGCNSPCDLYIGIEELNNSITESDNILLYPNPTKGIFNIRSEQKVKWVQLFNVQGRLIHERFYNQNQIELSLNEQKEGIYFIRMQLEDGEWASKKLILDK